MASNTVNVVETDFLVVGAGPAGSSMGSFLGQNGKTRGYTLLLRKLNLHFGSRHEGNCNL
jgi:ribulose 1,5-bisphosphate synthetase/thiazole synthase